MLDICFSDITLERFLDVLNAVGDVIRVALSNHLDGAIGEIAYRAGELMSVGDTLSGEATAVTGGCEAEADALDLASENYMFGCLAHFKLTVYCRLDNLAPFWVIY